MQYWAALKTKQMHSPDPKQQFFLKTGYARARSVVEHGVHKDLGTCIRTWGRHDMSHAIANGFQIGWILGQ